LFTVANDIEQGVPERMASASTEKRDARLDELRGLAICAVFVSHAALVFRNDLALARVLSLPALGVGVDLFFVISGYLVVERAARSVATAGGFWRGAAAFWAGRVIRIGVPAWVTIVGLYLAARLGALKGVRGEDLVAGAGAGSFANFYWAPCFEGRDGCGDPLLSSHFWSLASEMQFYALAPFIATLERRSTWIVALAALATGAALPRPWGGFWWTFRPDALLVGVVVGMETRGRADWLNRVPEIGIGLAIYWLLVAAVLARVLSIGGIGVGPVVVAAIFGAVVAGRRGAGGARQAMGTVLLRWLGERSFSIYLVHLPLLSGLRAALLDLAPPGVVAVLAALGAVLAALCLEGLVTRPSMLAGRRVAARICESKGAKAPWRVEVSNG
jgi:peptidoglycan/LPS O-acetylase OafA/YrhL